MTRDERGRFSAADPRNPNSRRVLYAQDPHALGPLFARVEALPKPQRDRLVRLISHALVDLEREVPDSHTRSAVRGLGGRYIEGETPT